MGQIIQEEIEEAAAKATAAAARAEKREIAKNMLRKGMSVSDIAECTGVSKAEVEKLRLN
jgi:predicted transposase/invertase (TIGR01784 family)